ncbi:ParB-like protein [Sphingomonas oligophenolica]|uniref:ParB-like protein n=1 Tax=Sphingomonas oligophenolica TaxID=301154 RepID=A0ABU9Y0S2_9SPHN
MIHDFEPLLHPVKIDDLRPTQMTVGYREVERKRREWRERVDRDGPDYLGRHMIPAVIGPKGRAWIIDNHHLARALHDEGVKDVLIRIVADLSHVKDRLFKTFLDNRNWLHPYDADGRIQPSKAIPRHIGKLKDDPYRSLAGELRRAGGYAKSEVPYTEFLWADYLRHQIPRATLEEDFEGAVEKALKLARKPPCGYLPGWAGPHD